MKNKIWDSLSKDYTDHIYTNEHILFPAAMKHINKIRNKEVLDLGCGAGVFSEILNKKGAKVTGFDSSAKMIEIAKRHNGEIKYIHGKAEELSKKVEKKFDYIIMIMFFCCIDNKSNLYKIFTEISKVLKKDGKIIFIDYHPRGYKNINSFLLKQKLSKNFNYTKSPQKFKVELKNKKNKFIKFFDYHWTLEDYRKAADNSNLKIEKISELNSRQSLIINNIDVLDFFRKEAVYMLVELKKEKNL